MEFLQGVVPPLEAFVVGAAAIYLDCYQTARKQVVRVPPQILQSRGVAFLAAAVGVVAVGIFLYSDHELRSGASSPLGAILTLRIENTYIRAAYVGLLTLAIIRSKLLDLRGAPFGLEYLYTEGRLRALVPAFTEWWSKRDQFISQKKAVAFAYSNYFNDLEGLLDSAAKLEGANSETERSLAELKRQKPTPPPDPVRWDLYYRTLTRLGLDTLGEGAFKRMPGF